MSWYILHLSNLDLINSINFNHSGVVKGGRRPPNILGEQISGKGERSYNSVLPNRLAKNAKSVVKVNSSFIKVKYLI